MSNRISRLLLSSSSIRKRRFQVDIRLRACMSRQLVYPHVAVTSLLILALLVWCNTVAYAQTSSEVPSGDEETPPQSVPSQRQELNFKPVDLKSLPKNLFLDQKDFWTAPLHLSKKQWEWTLLLSSSGAAH